MIVTQAVVAISENKGRLYLAGRISVSISSKFATPRQFLRISHADGVEEMVGN